MRGGGPVELVKEIGKDILKQNRPRWNINKRSTDMKPILRGSRQRRHWAHLGWGTGKIGSYLPNQNVFMTQTWKLRDFVVAKTDATQLKPYVSPSADREDGVRAVYFGDLFSDELVSEELKNNPRLLQACRDSADRLKAYIMASPKKKKANF